MNIIFAHPLHASEQPDTLSPACRGRVLRGCASLPLPLSRTAKPLRPLAPLKARPQKDSPRKGWSGLPPQTHLPPPKARSIIPFPAPAQCKRVFLLLIALAVLLPCPALARVPPRRRPSPAFPPPWSLPRVPPVCPPGAGRRFGCRCRRPRSALR